MAYKEILKNAIRTFEDLEKWLTGQKARVDPRLRDVIAKYPMRVNTYYLGLIEKMNDGIWKQAIPDVEELEHYMDLTEDPLDVDAQGGRGKVPVDLGFSDGISEDRKGGTFTSAIGLGKVYVNDPIERVAGKPVRYNPNRK